MLNAYPVATKRSARLDALMDLAISRAEAESGHKLNRAKLPANALAGVKVGGQLKPQGAPKWTEAEDTYLANSLGWLTDAQIGEELGRTEISVHLRWSRELHLPAPSKASDVITAHRAAELLGIDGHKIIYWVDCGMIPGRKMAGGRAIRLIQRTAFYVWATSPKNWVYFDIHKVVDLHLKRLIELRAARWNDEWWTTRRVADHHGVTTNEIKRYIKLGYLPAYRLPISLGGREHDRKWSYWFVLRSHALEVKFINHNAQSAFTPRADAWILKAHDELGMTFNHIGLTMKIGKPLPGGSNKAIVYRYRQLKTLAMQKRGKRK